MSIKRFQDNETSVYTIASTPDCEYVNPVYWFSTIIKKAWLEMRLDAYYLQKVTPTATLINTIKNEMDDDWQEKYQKAIKTILPVGLTQILLTNKKKNK